MKKILLLTMLMTVMSIVSYAQSGLLTGQVTDSQKLSLPGAVLRLSPGNIHTITDAYGKFQFLNVPAGEYQLAVTYIGYNTYTSAVKITAGKVLGLSINMDEAAVMGKEVVIMGDRLRGQAKALNVQKNNPNITNIVSADQVGRFPDANIGDAIKRIPGITMQNDQGEARNIIIRGLAPELNSVTLNGDRIPSAEGDNRRVQMDLIPSDMIQTIEVNKTLTPDMDADAIGGSVNLVTRAAPNGERISATVSGGYSAIREKPLYNTSFIYGNRFLDKKLGIVLSGSLNSNNYGSDNVEAVWQRDDFGNTYIEEQDIRKYDVVRIRRSAAAAIDYKFNEKNRINFNAMYNWRDDRENRYRLSYKDIEPVYDASNTITGFEGAIDRETKGGINGGRVKSARLEEQKVQNYSLRGDHLIGSKLDLDWAVSYSTASEYRPDERYINYETEGVSFSSNFDTPNFPLLRPTTAPALGDYELGTISQNTDKTKEDELGMKLNFRIPFSLINDQKGRIRFGGRLRLKTKDRNNTYSEYSPAGSDMSTLAQAGQQYWGGEKWNPDTKYVPGTFAAKKYLGGLALNNSALFEQEDVPGEYLAVNYHAKETITAGYVRFDQDLSSKLSLIAGVRLENTSINYEGNLIQNEDSLEGTRTVKNSYLNVLPGVTFKYTPLENFIVRAAATTGIARPNYYSLSPYVNTILDDNAIDAGNADLKASYAWNYDLMGEYYFKSVGLISGGVFYKQINDFIYQFRDENLTTASFASQFPGLPNPVPAGENWTLTQARNGESVKVYGFEVALQRQLDFLPGFLKGFGIYTNYTYTKSKADGIYNEDGEKRTGITLPGTAPHMFNASLSWENKKFSARISLNHAASYLDELGGNSFEDRYYDKQTFLDANASYTLLKSLRIFAEVNNITNQPLRYYQGVSSQTMQMEYYTTRFNLGLKFDLTR
jgi:TonB-dependent receptor